MAMLYDTFTLDTHAKRFVGGFDRAVPLPSKAPFLRPGEVEIARNVNGDGHVLYWPHGATGWSKTEPKASYDL